MNIDVSSVDYVLSTTRSVRLRLDFEREVDMQVILDCIDIAEQAPTGGNLGSRRWIVITEQKQKEKIADLYFNSAGKWMVKARDSLVGTGHPNEKMMEDDGLATASNPSICEGYKSAPYCGADRFTKI